MIETRFTPAEIAQVQALLEEGKTPEQVASALNITRFVLNRRLYRSGYEIELTRSLKPILLVNRVAEQATATA